MSLKVDYFPLGPLGENTYLITDEATGETAVIDPGYFGSEAQKRIGDKKNLRYILLTHGHHDHFAAAQDYIDAYPDAVFAAPEKDTYLMYKGSDNKYFADDKANAVCPEADLLLKEGDVIRIGESELKVIETPGHTEGSICFVNDKFLFSGDLIFRLSVGRTDFETGDWNTLVRSIQEKIYTLDDDTVVLSGHGPATTIGYEKKANPFV
jgi:glyoxylase-like metal-dependent hydrolase (beta-lactamase superfamily II)